MKPLTCALTGLAFAFALPAFAQEAITVDGAYARFMPGSMAGAAFMTIHNHSGTEDRLTGVTSEIAERTELHTHKQGADGTMQMLHVPEGFAIPAEGTHELKRGGDHVMFMGLKQKPADGDTVHVILTFEQAGEVAVDIPVDSKR